MVRPAAWLLAFAAGACEEEASAPAPLGRAAPATIASARVALVDAAPDALDAPARGDGSGQPSASSALPACADAGTLECPTYERYVNRKYGFSVDVPTFFTRGPADADGRGQPFGYGPKARLRAWTMFDNPPMGVAQLYGDWTRRLGVSFKTLVMNTWVVRGTDERGRSFYSRSILSEGLITTVELSFDRELDAPFEPILARIGSSLMPLPGVGLRGKTH